MSSQKAIKMDELQFVVNEIRINALLTRRTPPKPGARRRQRRRIDAQTISFDVIVFEDPPDRDGLHDRILKYVEDYYSGWVLGGWALADTAQVKGDQDGKESAG